MKAYCINLDSRPDRLAHMEAQAGRAGLVFERLPAVNASDPAVAAAAARLAPSPRGLPISAGAYGCFQSHREAWRRLLASEAAHAIVLEDDVILAPGAGEWQAPGWIPEDAGLVRLETSGRRLHLEDARSGPGRRQLARLRSQDYGTGAYAVSAAAAAALLAATETFSEPVDDLLFSERPPLPEGLAVYQVVPAPAVQGKRAHLVGASAEGSEWAESSIPERHQAGSGGAARGPAPEGRAARLSRRLREELRARRLGTRYVVVPHG